MWAATLNLQCAATELSISEHNWYQNMSGWAIQLGGDVHALPTSNRGWVGIRGFSYRVISNKNCSEWSEAPDLAGDAEHSTMARTSATNKNDVADIGVKCGGELKELVSI